MENMSNLTKKTISDDEGVAPVTTAPVDQDPAEILKAAKVVTEKDPISSVTGAPARTSGFMSVEDAAKLGYDTENTQKIDVNKEQLEAERKKFAANQRAKEAETMSMLQGALNEEEARLQRLHNTENADEETRKKLLGENDPVVEAKAKVTYEERLKESKASTNPTLDPYDLMPGYTDEPEEEEEDKKSSEKEAPDPSDDEYGQYIRELEVATVEDLENPAVWPIKETRVETVSSGRNRIHSPLGDQAFMNAINKFKKDNFGRVTTILPNSGFMCDVVGTGIVDLQNLYLNVDRNMSTYDYQLEQMRTVIRNVVGTSPKVSAENLQNMIHFQDFQMLAYAHICATLRSVETVTNCTECGKPFRITSKPNMLIMNMDELSERRIQIENAPNIEACSLMTFSREIQTSVGITVILGHPSYADMIRSIRGYQEYSKSMTDSDKRRFESTLQLLYMIRKMKLPSGVSTNNIYQAYQTLLLLSDDDFELVNKEVKELLDQIITPKFGIKEVTCPHCGKVIKDVAYDGLIDLLFYHTTINSYLKNPES